MSIIGKEVCINIVVFSLIPYIGIGKALFIVILHSVFNTFNVGLIKIVDLGQRPILLNNWWVYQLKRTIEKYTLQV